LIWRHQAYIDRPLLARQDVTAFTALRKWQKGFYDLPPVAADQE
jgi:3-ketosteroid 9alpha-monooxygenase subunit A